MWRERNPLRFPSIDMGIRSMQASLMTEPLTIPQTVKTGFAPIPREAILDRQVPCRVLDTPSQNRISSSDSLLLTYQTFIQSTLNPS